MPDDLLLARPAPLAPGRSRSRRGCRLLAVAVASSVLLFGAACSDDSDGGDEADRSTTEPTGSTDSTTTTVDEGRGRPLNENEELVAALAAPADFAPGLEVSPDQVGQGAFQPGLCPDQEIEVTWEDQASQGLVRTGEGGTLIVKQSVLAFADAEAADAFIDAYVEAVPACVPTVRPEEVPGIGERAVRIVNPAPEGPPTGAGALVRVGVHVVYVEATGDPAANLAEVVSNDLLTRLVALLPV